VTNPPPRDIAAWRREYEDRGLGEGDLGTDPIVAFRGWLDAADLAGLHEPNAMVVSTVGPDGPSSRMVLLKGLDARGFVFFTNYRSRKSAELDADAACALLFPWHPLQRQVRVEGIASRTSADESDDYFASRPRPAQLGAWSSPQSEVVESRDYLEQRFLHEQDRFADSAQIPRPEHWGGIRVRPHRVEFWQGRPGRLHDRVRFDRVDDSRWAIERLAP
jgi:pyridoxamine 5'-phosphate oxidase